MLTTSDNPFSPLTEWKEWLAFDQHQGYNTNELLARIGTTSDELPDEVVVEDISDAIDRIIALHPGGLYVKLEIPDDIDA